MYRLLLLLLWAGLVLQAQPPGRIPFRSYGPGEGLTASWVYDFAQDPDGQYWAGTDAGLMRFDGRRFLAQSGPPIPEGRIRILPEGGNRVWVASPRGLLRFQAGQWREFGLAEGLPQGPATHLGKDARGALWVLVNQLPFVSLDGQRFTPPHAWSNGSPVRTLHAHPEDAVLLVDDHALYVWHAPFLGPWQRIPLPQPLEGEIGTGASADGRLWLRDRHRVWSLDTARKDWTAALPDRDLDIHSEWRTRDGRWWVMTSRGPIGLGQGSPPFRISREVTFSLSGTRCLTIDREGCLWVGGVGIHGTWGLGSLQIQGAQEGIKGSAWQTLRDRRGRLWLSHQDGLSVGLPGRWHRVIPGPFFNRILEAPDGTIWASGDGSVQGLHQVHPDTLHAVAIPPPQPDTPFGRGLAIQGAEIWAGSRSRGLWAYHTHTRTWRLVPHPRQPDEEAGVAYLTQDPSGKVILATRRRVHVLLGEAWIPVPGTLDSEAMLLTFGPDGELWVGYRGLPRFTRHDRTPEGTYGTGRVIEPDLLRPDVRLYAAALEDRAHLWLGTNLGAYRVDLRDGQFQLLGREQGLPLDDCDQNGLRFDPDGSLWISTGLGLLNVPRLPAEPEPPQGPPLLFRAFLAGREQPPQSAFRIRHGQGGLELAFASPSLRHHGHTRFQARVEGRDSAWEPLPEARLFLADLAPGTHRVRVRAIPEGEPPSAECLLTLQVLPAWWQTWWARLAFLGLSGALVAGLIALRNRALSRKNAALAAMVEAHTRSLDKANRDLAEVSQTRSAFLASLSHELRTPLNSVLLYGQLVQERADALGDAGLSRDALRIQSAGNHLVSLLNGILDLSRIEAGRMEVRTAVIVIADLLEEVQGTLIPLAQQGGNLLRVVQDPACLQITADPLKVRQILMNLTGNAAKYTERGIITLKVEPEGGGVAFQVVDTGIGIEPAQLARLFESSGPGESGTGLRRLGGGSLGLALSRRLAELMGGTLRATSTLGEGSTFTLWLPG